MSDVEDLDNEGDESPTDESAIGPSIEVHEGGPGGPSNDITANNMRAINGQHDVVAKEVQRILSKIFEISRLNGSTLSWNLSFDLTPLSVQYVISILGTKGFVVEISRLKVHTVDISW